jgi:hypothetical protein
MKADLRRRRALLVLGLGAALSCGSKPVAPGEGRADGSSGGGDGAAGDIPGPTIVTRDIDILFMVDDSRGFVPAQQKLLINFPVFVQALQQLPGGLPNVHIAVVSSDMGSGAYPIELCNNDRGIFQSTVGRAAPATCTSTGLAAGETFISNVEGQANYTGKLEDVFACIAALGDDGCGYEAPLASVARALGADGAPAPTENAGFLRPNARLAIVVVTDEDDCSVPPDSTLFASGPGHQYVSDPEGPLTSYRCNEFGHLCNGAAPPRTMAAQFATGACVPAEEQGRLVPVHTLVQGIKQLKADPSKILVSVIAGPPEPYAVELTPPLLAEDPSMWPEVDHSCMEASGGYADPGVRLAAFAKAFGANGLYQTICAPSFAPALQAIAAQIGKAVNPP